MNEQEKKDAGRTCSEILFAALEEFTKAEAKHVVVLFSDENDDAVMIRNATHTQTIGLCDYGIQCARRGLFRGDEK